MGSRCRLIARRDWLKSPQNCVLVRVASAVRATLAKGKVERLVIGNAVVQLPPD